MFSANVLTTTFADPESFENNRLVVNEFLQVKGHSNAYAIGDCTNTKEFKMAAHAGRQGELLAENFLRSLKGRDTKPYQTGKMEQKYSPKKQWFLTKIS